jgi:hypothetical protein
MKVEGVTVIAAARQAALEAESHIGVAMGMLAHVRSELSRVEEENRNLKIEAAKQQTQFYTEREFAQLLKVSVATIARLRKDLRIDPSPYIGGTLVRYSSVHLERAYEIFGEGRKRKRR